MHTYLYLPFTKNIDSCEEDISDIKRSFSETK